jgi:hypothetical protein
MSIDLEQIRSANPIEDVVAQRFALKKAGTRFVGVEHDSLVVVPRTQMYFWNSKDEQGDVFDFAGRHLLNLGTWNPRDAAQFMEAVRYLAKRAGITIEEDESFKRSHTWGERQLVQRLHDTLLNTHPALEYVTKARGWALETVRAARIGFMPADKRALVADLNLPDKWRAVIGKFPTGMMVYPHLEGGRLTYLSGRSIEGKQHYNPPRELIGERQPYYNHAYSMGCEQLVLVEGQADAITFGEWGIAAVALGGMTVSDELLRSLKGYKRVFVALDNTDDANAKSREIALALRGQTYLPRLPGDIKDANEWLVKANATAEDASSMLNRAQHWLAAEVSRAAFIEGLERQDAIRELFGYAIALDDFALAEFKGLMARIGVKGRLFTEMLTAARNGKRDDGDDDDMPEVLNDDVPILSPALGFQREMALVTVSVMERTKGKRLNIQPYLVTSTREMRRLRDEQIITINEKEVALQRHSTLSRWRSLCAGRGLRGGA